MKPASATVPPAITKNKELNSSLTTTTTKTSCVTKKIAIVTPEQRPKKINTNQTKMLECKNIEENTIDVMPSFSCKKLLSSIIRRQMSLDNDGTCDLKEYQIFSIDCSKTIQVLCEFKHFLNNNNDFGNDLEFLDGKGYLYKCFGCKSSWPMSNNNISSIVSHVLSTGTQR